VFGCRQPIGNGPVYSWRWGRKKEEEEEREVRKDDDDDISIR
jgi:hypothetical protein